MESLVSLSLALGLVLSEMDFGGCWAGRAGAPVRVQGPLWSSCPISFSDLCGSWPGRLADVTMKTFTHDTPTGQGLHPLLRNHALDGLWQTRVYAWGGGPPFLGWRVSLPEGSSSWSCGGKRPICLIWPSLGQSNCPFNLCGSLIKDV